MKQFKIAIICMAALMLLAVAGCGGGFKHANSAKSSMHDVNESAAELKDETETSKARTEEMKQEEAVDTTEGHQW